MVRLQEAKRRLTGAPVSLAPISRCKFGFLRLRVLGFCGRLIAHSVANPECEPIINRFTELNFWNIVLVSCCYSLSHLTMLSLPKVLFFSYPWNNFAHNVIERIIGVLMTAPDRYQALKIKVTPPPKAKSIRKWCLMKEQYLH